MTLCYDISYLSITNFTYSQSSIYLHSLTTKENELSSIDDIDWQQKTYPSVIHKKYIKNKKETIYICVCGCKKVCKCA